MDDIECINIKRNDLRIKNSKLNKESVDDCITVKIRRSDSHADKNTGAIVMQSVMMIMQYLDIMYGAVTTRQKVVNQNTMVGQINHNFKEFHQKIDLSRVVNIHLMKKIDPIEQLWLKVQQIYKKEIINELYIDRERQKEKIRNKKEYLWYLQYKIDQFEEKRQDLQYRITNDECDLDYGIRSIIKLAEINEKLKLPIKMSEKEREEKIKENELNEIMNMKDKYDGLRKSNKIFNGQLAEARAILEQLKSEEKVQTIDPEPQAPAPANTNTQHGFLRKKYIAMKSFFKKKFKRRN